MNSTDLKRGDVIAINWGPTRRLAIFEKFDTTVGNQDGLYIYAEMDMRSNELYFKPDDCDFSYELRDIAYRLADDNEKNTLYNAIGKHFTEEYDKDWYNHFTDSSYFDIQDYLLDIFCIDVKEYDDDLIYPDFINDIHQYIWNGCCKAMNVPNGFDEEEVDESKEKMVPIDKIKNQLVYLWIKPDYLFKELSINEFNNLLARYQNDIDAVVEDYNEDMEGHVFITTNLYNVLINHTILDLRFNIGYKSKYHKTNYEL